MESTKLPKSVEKITYNGKEILLLGTAHVSKKSVEDVSETVEIFQPDTICIELCEARFAAQKDKDRWKKMDIFKVIKEKKTLLLFAQLMMSSFYRKLGQQLEVTPGAEMLKGAEEAKSRNCQLVLADRNIDITLRRVWGGLSFFQKMKFISSVIPSLLFSSEEIDDETVEELKGADHLEAAMDEFAKALPGVRKSLIDERDMYLAEKIKSSKGDKVVAVVGAAHVPGIKKWIDTDIDLEKISEIPPKSIVPTLIGWGIPLIIVGLMVFGFINGGAGKLKEMALAWILINGVLSALGALIALGHPLTIIAAFIAAPITSLNPAVGAGYVTGMVQAFLHKPTVEDMEKVPEATATARGLWGNALTRIILVVIFSSLGSALGTAIALGKIGAIFSRIAG